MESYFGIRYEFDKEVVSKSIARTMDEGNASYICVADGVVLAVSAKDPAYREAVNGGLFSICDSGWVPIYIRWIYGRSREQYCGSEIFRDIVSSRQYRMMFMGTHRRTLDALKERIMEWNPDVATMSFVELPFLSVEEFDYAGIARLIELDGADVIWVALGCPKQELFMARLKPHLKRGVMIAVGAAFKFYSGLDERRAPSWIVRLRMEFLWRVFQDPRKQLRRCANIVVTTPPLLFREWCLHRRRR
jgi:N-acetylglucosaminyldiphosphoundecaprenol N-acetyl-beta-D-mannosaminyltransferase